MICRSIACAAALLAALTVLKAGPAWAVPLDSSSFNHQYNGDTYDNPNLSGSGTSFTEFAGETGVWSPSSDGDILTFRNTILNGNGFFDNDEWGSTVDNSLGWTIEWRVKIGADFDDDPTFGAFQVFAKEDGSTSTTRRVAVNVGQDFTFIGNVGVIADTSDNTDAFHVFRIAQPADSSNITVWRDGIEIYNGISRTSNNSGVDMYFGDGSGSVGGPTVMLDYFRWDSTGPYEPVPEPSSIVLFGLIGAGCLVWARHRRRIPSAEPAK